MTATVLLSYEAVPFALVGTRILRGEFLSDLHEFHPGASLLLVMKRGGSRRLSSYRLHNLRVRIAYEGLGSVMIGGAALSAPIDLLRLLVSSVGSRAIEGLDGLGGRGADLVVVVFMVIVVMGWVRVRQMVTAREVLSRGAPSIDSGSLT